MPTLWQLLTAKPEVEVPVESKFYNPVNARIGNAVQIDTLDLEGLSFTIQGLREVKRVIEGRNFFFADYDLLARPFNKTPVNARLRFLPLEHKDGDLTHKVLLLNKIESCKYDKAFHEGLAYEKNQGVFTDGVDYWRIDDVQSEWIASTATLKDLDQSGKVDLDEVVRGNLTYWDFWREDIEVIRGDQVDHANIELKTLSFYFVEMDESGTFEFWTGQEIDPSRVILS